MSEKDLDIDRIARRLGGEPKGEVPAGHGFFGALELLAEVRSRFQTPSNGGRSTDPAWDERRLVPLASPTLARLERLAAGVSRARGHEVSAMQVAAILLENAASEARVEGALKELATVKKHVGSTLGSLLDSLGLTKAVERLTRKKRASRRVKKRSAGQTAAPRTRGADFRRRK